MNPASGDNGDHPDHTIGRYDGGTIIGGTIIGIVAWLLGYVLTYVLVAPDVRESPLHRVIDAFDGEPATYEMVGWVFFNAHFVNTRFHNVPIIGSFTTSFIGADGFSVMLFVIPVGVLVAAGLGLARYRTEIDPGRGALTGILILPGYLALSIAGVFRFEVTLGGASGAPDVFAAIFVAGIMYPVMFAGAGGALAGFITEGAHEPVTRTDADR